MKVSSLVDVSNEVSSFNQDIMIGVNWSAIGPVTPRKARAFAREINRAADRADRLRAKAQSSLGPGWKLRSLP